MTFRIATPGVRRSVGIIVKIPQAQAKIHSRLCNVVQIRRGITRLSIITRGGKAKTGSAVEYRSAHRSRGWFGKQRYYICLRCFHDARFIDERFRGCRRTSSVNVCEGKNGTRNYQADEPHASKKKEQASARKTHSPTVML